VAADSPPAPAAAGSAAGDEPLSAAVRRGALAAILAVGAALRIDRLDWGLPEFLFPDTVNFHLRPAAELVAKGDVYMSSSLLGHPPLLGYLLSGLIWLRNALTGRYLPGEASLLRTELPWIDLLGRGLTVALALLSLLVCYRLTLRLFGARVALLATAAFALCPIHVLESHRTTPDILMLLLMLLSADLALLARERRKTSWLLLSFAAAGLAGAAKYTGIAIATLPVWVALEQRRAWTRRLGLALAGGLVALALLAAGFGPVALQPERIYKAVHFQVVAIGKHGMVGTDIMGQGWQYARFVYPAVLTFPYMMGWPFYLLALAGVPLAWRHHRRATLLLAIAIGPFFVGQATGKVIVPRYFLPFAPYFAIFAAVALDRLWRRRRGAGLAVLAATCAYTGVLDASFNRQMRLEPQKELGAFLERVLAAQPQRLQPLRVGYPSIFLFPYDSAMPYMSRPEVQMVYFPDPYVHLRLEPQAPPVESEVLRNDRRWVKETGVEVVVVPNWIEYSIVREKPHGYAAGILRRLADGSLGFRLAAAPSTRFFTEDLYAWGDPMLRTHTDTGIQGYRIYLRNDLPLP